MRINLLTGTAWTKSIIVDGDEHSDILQLINEYYNEHGELPVTMYTTNELSEDELESYIPINGGEFWIEGIASIDYDDSIINEESKTVKEDMDEDSDEEDIYPENPTYDNVTDFYEDQGYIRTIARILAKRDLKIPVSKDEISKANMRDFDTSTLVIKESFGGMDYIELGSVPYDEDCVQVSKTEDYIDAMKEECKRYKEMLEKRFDIPDGVYAYFAIKKFEHDFGTYFEVVIKYQEDDEQSSAFAIFVENNLPATWDDDQVLEFTEEAKIPYPDNPNLENLKDYYDKQGYNEFWAEKMAKKDLEDLL